MLDLNKPVPTVEFPSIKNYSTIPLDEEIVSIKERGILVRSMYYEDGIPGAYKDCYARETVVEMLLKAQNSLPKGYRLLVYDAYRPICIQQRLWNYYRRKIINSNKGLSDEDIDFKTSFFVSKPSYDMSKPSLHNTGGAVDLTIVDSNGKELNMGTKFDDFSDRAWTNHFELYESDEEVRNNRRMLYNVMIDAGFTNLPSEWWHYDFGTKFWAYFKDDYAKYTGVLDVDFPNRIILS